MKCIDINSDEIDLNQWEILGEMPFKDGVNILYLKNKWRTPDQEQIFLVGYRKEKQIKEKDPMGLVNMKKKKRKDFTTAKDVKLNIDENLFFLCEEDKKYFQDHSFMSREEVKENILRWTNTMNDLKTPLAKKIFESIIREMKIGLDGMIKNEK